MSGRSEAEHRKMEPITQVHRISLEGGPSESASYRYNAILHVEL